MYDPLCCVVKQKRTFELVNSKKSKYELFLEENKCQFTNETYKNLSNNNKLLAYSKLIYRRSFV